MTKFFILLFFALTSSYSIADQYINGYHRKDGTYVNGHFRKNSNSTNIDNYSTKYNLNYYTGELGSTPPDYSFEASKLRSDKQIISGPKGGQYYINKHGNKNYVPKR